MRVYAPVRLVAASVLGLLLCTTLPGGGGVAWAQKPGASAADIEGAKKHMAAGVSFMQNPDGAQYEEAYAEFTKAYELSGSLNALQNLAICAQNLELDGEAIGYYEKYLAGKGASIDPATKEQVDRDLAGLKAATAWVTLTTDKVGAQIVDTRFPKRGSPISNEYKGSIQGTKLGIHPGKHKFVATLAGKKEQVWEVELPNGAENSHTFTFEGSAAPVTAEGFTDKDQKGLIGKPVETGKEGDTKDKGEGAAAELPWYPFLAGGLTVALAVPWIILGATSFGQKSDYDSAVSARAPDQQDLYDKLKQTNTLADVFMGLTLAGGVATIITVIVAATSSGDDTSTPQPEATTARRSPPVEWTVSPAIDPQHGGGATFTVRY
jgi:hypothetical protein